jgi:hypothetical protein
VLAKELIERVPEKRGFLAAYRLIGSGSPRKSAIKKREEEKKNTSKNLKLPL